MVTAEIVRGLFDYDPVTGAFRWRKKPHAGWNKATLDAGSVRGDGSLKVGIDGRAYRVARIIWLYQTGEWPKLEVDHEDRNQLNNCWANLREATDAQQQANRGMMKNNTSGYRGVHLHKNKWRARIRRKHLGSFPTKEGAFAAYSAAAKALFGEFFPVIKPGAGG